MYERDDEYVKINNPNDSLRIIRGVKMRIKTVESVSLNLSDGRSIKLNPNIEYNQYCFFSFLPEPITFSEYWQNIEISLVQVHSTECGFCGVFAWNGKELTSLDGDNYNPDMKVIGYSYFNDEEYGECLDILVGNDW